MTECSVCCTEERFGTVTVDALHLLAALAETHTRYLAKVAVDHAVLKARTAVALALPFSHPALHRATTTNNIHPATINRTPTASSQISALFMLAKTMQIYEDFFLVEDDNNNDSVRTHAGPKSAALLINPTENNHLLLSSGGASSAGQMLGLIKYQTNKIRQIFLKIYNLRGSKQWSGNDFKLKTTNKIVK
ncbi:hypothetical protein HK100_010134 [Physocladia obscura]|uniref:Uncharacterized protein n=1 Tax=Physocladia obscura TaxID=109957 RepID=A0AAD5XIZ9_9FUNG|nr:hypothetical protein HK100_010134 [Physocladia obscura]